MRCADVETFCGGLEGGGQTPARALDFCFAGFTHPVDVETFPVDVRNIRQFGGWGVPDRSAKVLYGETFWSPTKRFHVGVVHKRFHVERVKNVST